MDQYCTAGIRVGDGFVTCHLFADEHGSDQLPRHQGVSDHVSVTWDEQADGAVVRVVEAAVPPEPSRPCMWCGHPADEHGPSGCAADDEAAMTGCDCSAVRRR